MLINYNKHKEAVKKIVRKNWYLQKLTNSLLAIYARGGVKISKHSGVKLKIYNIGKNNSCTSGENCLIDKLDLKILGSNNKIIIGNNVTIKSNCSFIISGNNCSIEIGDGSTMTTNCQLEAQEEDTHIVIGKDCMFSNHIRIRTNDSHFIYDAETGKRTNVPSSVNIGNHVWLAAYSTVMKGVTIGDGSVIGYRSVVTKPVPNNCVAVGMPAKVVQQNIKWTREKDD